jgi:hypothetical protein
MLDIRLLSKLFKFKILEVTGVNDLLTHLANSVASAVKDIYTVYVDTAAALPFSCWVGAGELGASSSESK